MDAAQTAKSKHCMSPALGLITLRSKFKIELMNREDLRMQLALVSNSFLHLCTVLPFLLRYLKGTGSRVYPTYCLFPCLVQSSVATNTSIHSTQDPFSSQSQKGFQQLVLHV